MNDTAILALVRANLENPAPAVNDFLLHLIHTAEERIEQTGIDIDASSTSDMDLIVMYASYLYRKRKTDEPMPRMLRLAINDRLLAQKGNVDDDDG